MLCGLPESSHCNDCVPKRGWDAAEARVLHVLFGVVHDCGKNDDGHGQRKQHKAQLADTGLQRHAEDSETGRVSRKLENTKNSKNPESDESAADFVVGDDHKRYVIRKYSNDINNTHDLEKKVELAIEIISNWRGEIGRACGLTDRA